MEHVINCQLVSLCRILESACREWKNQLTGWSQTDMKLVLSDISENCNSSMKQKKGSEVNLLHFMLNISYMVLPKLNSFVKFPPISLHQQGYSGVTEIR